MNKTKTKKTKSLEETVHMWSQSWSREGVYGGKDLWER